MALELLRELNTGISGNYWRIGSVVVSCNDDPSVSIYMELYLNRAAKYSGKTPLLIEPTNMNLSQIDPTFDFDFRACVYNAMSNLPSWTNSKYIYEFDETYETRPIVNFVEVESDFNGSVELPAFQGSDLNNFPLTFEIVSQPSNGTITESNGVYIYTPNADWSGSDTAEYRCSNGTEFSKPAKIFLNVVNPVPTANNVFASCETNTNVVLTLSGSDPKNLPLTFSIVDQPSNGSINESNGVFTYIPNVDFVGLDSATFKANNGSYDSTVATININVTAIPNE